jgi:hypothetical protein
MFSKIVYIKMDKSALALAHVESSRIVEIKSEVEFGNSRMVVSNFSILESCIKKGLDELNLNASLLKLGPKVLIHPFDTFPDGLSEVESIALKQAALGAGAHLAYVYQGHALELNQVKVNCRG